MSLGVRVVIVMFVTLLALWGLLWLFERVAASVDATRPYEEGAI